MFRIFGPPGTGKTTTLLNKVDQALEKGVASTNIAFLAFTRKAAYEARERAANRFQLNPKEDLPYFRTLHSLAYSMIGKQHALMQKEDFDELSEKIGYSLNIASISEDEDLGTVTSDHPILRLINLARSKKIGLRQEYDISDIEYEWHEVNYVDRAYTEFKRTRNVIDFTDMLEKFAEEAMQFCPHFELCFLDEAQDLSPLQWDIAHKIDQISNRMYAAGDDDQAIYRWAGADVNHFIELDGAAEVLEQSFRVPLAVHSIAENISSRINSRFPKSYLPRKEEGGVQRIYSLEEIDLSRGTWLILAQANYMLTPVAESLKSGGYLFERNGHRSISEKISRAINGWEQLRKGKEVDKMVAQAIYDYMSGNGKRIARGFKQFKETEEEKMFDLATLQIHYGLNANDTMAWFDAMDKMPKLDVVYITAVLRRGEKFNAVPRISLSTIHGAKGGEADNVVLYTDLSTAALNQMGDDMHRVFYVGVTRTKDQLFIVEPEDAFRSYQI